jgi:hypothetical protein
MLNNPTLIEPGVMYFLRETLKNCYSLKEYYYNLFFNISVLIIFLIVLGSILYYRYKGKMTPKEQKKKDLKKQQYIMSLLQKYQSNKKGGSITGLPEYSSGKDIIF